MLTRTGHNFAKRISEFGSWPNGNHGGYADWRWEELMVMSEIPDKEHADKQVVQC